MTMRDQPKGKWLLMKLIYNLFMIWTMLADMSKWTLRKRLIFPFIFKFNQKCLSVHTPDYVRSILINISIKMSYLLSSVAFPVRRTGGGWKGILICDTLSHFLFLQCVFMSKNTNYTRITRIFYKIRIFLCFSIYFLMGKLLLAF